MRRSSNRLGLALVAVTLLGLAATALCGQSNRRMKVHAPARSRAEELLDRWNDIGNKLVAMAQDFSRREVRFQGAEGRAPPLPRNLLHAAALDFVLIRRISGSNLGPDFRRGRQSFA